MVALPHLRRGSRILTPNGERTVRSARARSKTAATRLGRPITALPVRSVGRLRSAGDRPPVRTHDRAKLAPTRAAHGPAVSASASPDARHASRGTARPVVRWPKPNEPLVSQPVQREPVVNGPVVNEPAPVGALSEPPAPTGATVASPQETSTSFPAATGVPPEHTTAAWPVVEPEPEPAPQPATEPAEPPGTPQQPIPGEEPAPAGPQPAQPTGDPGFELPPAAAPQPVAGVGRQRLSPPDSGPIPEPEVGLSKPMAKPPIKPSNRRQSKGKAKNKSAKGVPRPSRHASRGHGHAAAQPPDVIDLRDDASPAADASSTPDASPAAARRSTG